MLFLAVVQGMVSIHQRSLEAFPFSCFILISECCYGTMYFNRKYLLAIESVRRIITR